MLTKLNKFNDFNPFKERRLLHKSAYEFIATGNGYWVKTSSGSLVQIADASGNLIGDIKDTLNEGYIYVGDASNTASELDASGDAQFPIGNGTTLVMRTMQGDVAMDNQGNTNLSTGVKTGHMTSMLPGTVVEYTFPFNIMVETEQAATLCKTYDEGTAAFGDIATISASAEYTANYQLLPDTPAENDAIYFGCAERFGVILIDVNTVATYGADSLAWEYWDGGAWQDITTDIIYDHTDTTAQDGLRSFQQDGHIIFAAPGDWQPINIDGQDGMWVRARCTATVNVTQVPIMNSVEHKIVTSPTATQVPYNCSLRRARFTFNTVSGANNDTIGILCNLTTGDCTDQLTFTQALASHNVASLDMQCGAGDYLAMYIVQEDGTTEFADGAIEIEVAKD